MTAKYVSVTLSCLLLIVIAGHSDIAMAQESSTLQQDSERHQNNLRSAWDRGGVIMLRQENRERRNNDVKSNH